jgi:hypothetical protein
MYMHRVIIESPYASKSEGILQTNIRFARLCVRHSLSLGETPIAFHLLYTQPEILNDNDAAERRLGMKAAQAWYECADICAVYHEYGISNGMKVGIAIAKKHNLQIQYRKF